MWDAADQSLPPLPYPYDALEPHLHKKVVEWHHSRHQAGEAIAQARAEQQSQPSSRAGEASASGVADRRRQQISYASGAILHDLYWQSMHAQGRRRPPAALLTRLEEDFGSFEAWSEDFVAAAAVPRAGWVLLIIDPSDQRLRNIVVEGHDEGAIWGARVLVACDLWEHAYYAQYGPYRGEYVRAFLDLIDWEVVAQRFAESRRLSRQALPEGAGTHRPMPLPFSYHALRGISSQTLQWMHGAQYADCVRGRNEVERQLAASRAIDPLEYAALKRREPFYAAGQRLYELFWQVLGGNGGQPGGELLATMQATYGSFQGWRADLLAASEQVEAGWAVLVWDRAASRLRNLPVDQHHRGALWHSTPLLPISLWENAYYYDRGPNREAYLSALFENIRWSQVEALFTAGK